MLYLAILASLLARPAEAGARPVLMVEAPPELERTAAAVRALAALDWDDELELTGLDRFEGTVHVVLLPQTSLEARTTPSWVSAYALGAIKTIVVFPARVPSYPDRNLETLFRHEMAHLLVDRAAGQRPVPRWLHEGIATVAAREWGIEDSARFAAAVIGHRPQSTRDLDQGFSASASSAARSYALSAALVRYLRQRFGPSAPARILGRIAAGAPFPDAFLGATGVELGVVEHDFFGREVFWSTWLPFLSSSALLWMGITALALVAIRRRRRRDARLRALWEAEEELEDIQAWAEPGGEPEVDDPMRYN